MELLDADVKWYFKYANKPTLLLLVDKMPSREQHLYKVHKSGGSRLYWSEAEGHVSFFCHDPSHEEGFAGREFTLNLADGGQVTIKGPWSSRAGAMNCYFEPHCVDVVLYERDGNHPTLGYATAVTVDLAKKAAKLAGVNLVETQDTGDIRWDILEPKPNPENWTKKEW